MHHLAALNASIRRAGRLIAVTMVFGMVLSGRAPATTIYSIPVPPVVGRESWVESNLAIIASARRTFLESLADDGPSVVRPEYERRLGEIAFAANRGSDKRSPLSDFAEIFAALPSYTQLHLFVPETAVEWAEEELAELGIEYRASVYGVTSEFLSGRWKAWSDTIVRNSSIWMRDVALVGATGGAPRIYQPLAYRASSSLSQNDTDFIRELGGGDTRLKVVPFPHFIRGGNLLTGEIGGRLIAFIGTNEVQFNVAALPVLTQDKRGEDVVANDFLRDLKLVTGADKVVVLPNTRRVFHLDQALVFLAPGRVGVLKSVDDVPFDPAEEAMFSEIRRILADNGFTIVDIPSSPGHLGRFESSANALLFRNVNSGRPTALVPRFPDAEVTWEGQTFKSMMELVADVYRREGFAVVFVKDSFSTLQGNLHCVTLPLN
jgi:hypothetical protein